jgi:mono/diheme cytochrome c family protein
MKSHAGKAMVAATVLCMSSFSLAQQVRDYGREEYEANCASCHGTNGQGFGPMRPYLTKMPSDLTTIARRNGGVFPNQLMWEVIDGRTSTEIGPHGSREMPVWGNDYRAEAMRQAGGPSSQGPEWYVRGKIVALLDYLARMQVK